MGDNFAIYQALEQVQAGDVLVIDGGTHTSRTLISEIVASVAQSRSAAGMVIDGAVRDACACAK